MDVILIGIVVILVLAVILNPVNWIRLALLVAGRERRQKVIDNLQASISEEPDPMRRLMYQRFFDLAVSAKHE